MMWNFQKGTPVTITGDTSSSYFSVPAGKKVRNEFRTVQKQEVMIFVNRTVVTEMDYDIVSGGTVTGYVNTLAELLHRELEVGDIYVVVGNLALQMTMCLWDGLTWQETILPGEPIGYDFSTMPHILTRTGENEFTFGEAPWTDRKTGVAATGDLVLQAF